MYYNFKQRWFRAKMQQKRFLRDYQRIIQLQRVIRGWLNHRNVAASMIQRNVRRFLACRHRRKFVVGVIKFQVNTTCKKNTNFFFLNLFCHGFLGRGKMFGEFISEIASQVSFSFDIKAKCKQIIK